MPPLGLPPAPSIRGRRPGNALAWTDLGEITPEDLAASALAPARGATRLKALRTSHHRLAQILASGITPSEASAITGFCLSRISVLQSDPTFAELLSFYKGKQKEAYFALAPRMAALTGTAMEILQERMDEEPEKIPNSLLVEIASSGMDRLGLPVATKATVDHRHGLSAEAAEVLRNAVSSSEAGRVTTVVRRLSPETSSAPLLQENSPSAVVGETIEGRAELLASEAPGQPGGGEELRKETGPSTLVDLPEE